MDYPLIFPEAMTCKTFCIRLGTFTEGTCYVDEENIIYVLPSVWEIKIKGTAYSCHLPHQYGMAYYFEKDHSIKWEIGNGVPKEFEIFVDKAYEYDRLYYPKLCVLVM